MVRIRRPPRPGRIHRRRFLRAGWLRLLLLLSGRPGRGTQDDSRAPVWRPGAGVSQLLQDLVSAQAERTPDAVALRMADASTTYGELETQANQIARVLRDHGCRRGDRVAVVAPMTPNAIAALLAVLKADAIFVPLNASEKRATLASVVAECQPACLLTGAATAPTVDSLVEAGAVVNGKTVVGSLERTPIAGQRFFTAFSLAEAQRASGRAVASRN